MLAVESHDGCWERAVAPGCRAPFPFDKRMTYFVLKSDDLRVIVNRRKRNKNKI